MGLVLSLLDDPVVSALGCSGRGGGGAPGLKLQGAKSYPGQLLWLDLAVSSLPVQPYDAVHSLKKAL